MLAQSMDKLIEQGIAKKAVETALKMLEKGYPVDEISDITGLSKKEIDNLKKSQ